MKVRLIKASSTPTSPKVKPRPETAEIVDTLRSWVHEFKSDKANRPRLDFPGIDKSEDDTDATGRPIKTESDAVIG